MAFLDDFREEAREHLRILDDELLKLERDPSNGAPLREMFLSAHSIKGGAAIIGLTDIREISHAMEDIFAHLRDNREALDSDTADVLFRALDGLRVLIGRSVPGVGSADELHVPIVAALQARVHLLAAVDSAIPPRITEPAPPRALLVEDSTTFRLLASALLIDAGCDVDAVADGAEAANLLESRPYDLLVTGLETRGIRGLDLVHRARSSPVQPHIQVVIVSSDAQPDLKQRAYELGVNACIRKGSLAQDELVETVRELLEMGSSDDRTAPR